MDTKLFLIVLDGVPWRNFRKLFGTLEGWVDSGDARVWKSRSALPSNSASCYATLHTGVAPAVHGCLGNDHVFRLDVPDVFSEIRRKGGITGAVAHSFWSELFNRAPFDPVCDIEYDEPDSPTINHGRWHTMSGYNDSNQTTPADPDLFASLTNLANRFNLDYAMLHTSTLDSMGHRFGHECETMDYACLQLDSQLAPYIVRWREAGYEIMVTADHGQTVRGVHGGRGDDQQDTALYYFGSANGPDPDKVLRQTQIAPTILDRFDISPPGTMEEPSFLD